MEKIIMGKWWASSVDLGSTVYFSHRLYRPNSIEFMPVLTYVNISFAISHGGDGNSDGCCNGISPGDDQRPFWMMLKVPKIFPGCSDQLFGGSPVVATPKIPTHTSVGIFPTPWPASRPDQGHQELSPFPVRRTWPKVIDAHNIQPQSRTDWKNTLLRDDLKWPTNGWLIGWFIIDIVGFTTLKHEGTTWRFTLWNSSTGTASPFGRLSPRYRIENSRCHLSHRPGLWTSNEVDLIIVDTID